MSCTESRNINQKIVLKEVKEAHTRLLSSILAKRSLSLDIQVSLFSSISSFLLANSAELVSTSESFSVSCSCRTAKLRFASSTISWFR